MVLGEVVVFQTLVVPRQILARVVFHIGFRVVVVVVVVTVALGLLFCGRGCGLWRLRAAFSCARLFALGRRRGMHPGRVNKRRFPGEISLIGRSIPIAASHRDWRIRGSEPELRHDRWRCRMMGGWREKKQKKKTRKNVGR